MRRANMDGERKIRALIAKPGLDGHDRGAKVLVFALREAGIEVIYTGLHQTPEEIVSSAVQEDVDTIGLSILSGAHLTIVETLMNQMREKGISDIPIVMGGVIPEKDIPKLKDMGIRGIFTSGTSLREISDFIIKCARQKQSLERR
jgi:methylmalonyl-CoA mutase C-terminal domain/subunit